MGVPLADQGAAWTVVAHDAAQLGGGGVGVALGSLYGAVAQQRLDVADVHIVFEQHGGKGVPEHVRGHVRLGSAALGKLLYLLTCGLLAQASAATVDKERVAVGGGGLALGELCAAGKVAVERVPGDLVLNVSDALSRALAHDEDGAGGLVNVLEVEAAELGYAKAGFEQQLHDRALACGEERRKRLVRLDDAGFCEYEREVLLGDGAWQAERLVDADAQPVKGVVS